MSFSNLCFRKLTLKDIPSVKEISSQIWEGDDYISYVIENWILNENCFTFGIFDEVQLLAFSNIRLIHRNDEKIAWLEGGRVDPKKQKSGLGKELMRYSLDFARERDIKYIMFDTSSRNYGSISLAKKYGFNKLEFMHLLFIKKDRIKLNKWDEKINVSTIQVNSEKVFSVYQELQNGPISNLNIGWSYIPLTKKNLREINGKWWCNGKSVLLSYNYADLPDRESSKEEEIWIILYGEPKYAADILKVYLNKIHSSEWETASVFCRPKIAIEMLNMGFKYNEETNTDEHRGVLLFEKNLE